MKIEIFYLSLLKAKGIPHLKFGGKSRTNAEFILEEPIDLYIVILGQMGNISTSSVFFFFNASLAN